MARKKISHSVLKAIGTMIVRKNANIVALLRVLIFGVLFLCIALITLLIFIRSMPSTHAPDTVGQPLISGILLLQERALVPFVKIEYSDSTNQAAGTILKQRPSAGSYVRTGQKIELVVHNGVENITMPNLIGTAFNDVQNAVLFLDATGSIQYRIDTVTYDYSTQPVGTIILQTPQAGETVGYFTKIHVVVSLGPAETNSVHLPNLIGVHYNTALSQIIASGIQHSVVVSSVQNEDPTKELTVISQTPSSGTISDEQIVELGIQAPNQLPIDQHFGVHTSDLSAYEFGSNVEIVHIFQTQDIDNGDDTVSERLLLQFALFQDTVYLPYVLPIDSTLEIRVLGEVVDTLRIGN